LSDEDEKLPQAEQVDKQESEEGRTVVCCEGLK